MAKHDRDIRRMAYTDPLTGLANRLSFRELLDDRLLTLHANSGELALLFIDLDDFKRVNDTLGHEAGDEVLSQLSARLRLTLERFGANAADLARFGGDEFIVLLHGRRHPRGVGAPVGGIARGNPEAAGCLAASRCSSARRSASPCSRSTPTMRASCSRTPTSPCTRPRSPARTATASTAGPWTRRSSGASSWNRSCAAPGSAAN